MQTRAPDQVHVSIDPATCEVMEGHQHEVSDLAALADSIATLGQLHPSLVIEYADGRRLIAAGRRRWMACQQLGIPLIANIWHCEEENIHLELFAKAIRVAENTERCDPSAIDIAKQLQTIRNERQLPNARVLGEFVGMNEDRVKRYLSVFAASDLLQESARTHAIPLKPLMELTKCEKRLGVRATKKLLARFLKGELSTADLAKMRARPPRKSGSAKPEPKRQQTRIEKTSSAVLKAFASDPVESRPHIEELIQQLQALLPEEAIVS